MSNFTRQFTTDDDRVLEVDGTYRIMDNNVEDIEFEAWLLSDANNVNAPKVTLTPPEEQRLYEELMADPNTWEYDWEDWYGDVDSTQ